MSKVEGRDKFLKIIQFAARYLKSHYLTCGNLNHSAAWDSLSTTLMEGRKSQRILKGMNKIDQLFDDIPNAETIYEKSLVGGFGIGLALFWHWDYLAYLHKIKFIGFDQKQFTRLSRIPSYAWTAGNICQLLLGILTLQRSSKGIAEVRSELSSCAAVGAGNIEALKAKIQAMRVLRFKGWVIVVKSLADLVTSSSMNGVELQKRFPSLFGWMNDGTVGISGVVSASCFLFNAFPTKKDLGGKEGWQSMQTSRNSASMIFGLMQLISATKAGSLGRSSSMQKA
jgi:hypothetical protein